MSEQSQNVYVGLGSNLDEPFRQIKDACSALEKLAVNSAIKFSSLYRTTAMSDKKQPDYLNAVAQFKCSLMPLALLDALQSIENNQGRVRGEEPWLSRTLDLDLLLFGDQMINKPTLVVPHYGLTQRNFVIYPLYEVSPELVLPDGSLILDLYKSCSKSGIIKIESI